jgi:glycosyltransferase involved in cell wall biosynthesis
VATARELLVAGSDTRVVGHFGTYGDLVLATLRPALEEILERRADVRLCLLGAGSDHAAAAIAAHDPSVSRRVIGMGYQASGDIAAFLQACDGVVQPYADGASGRRTTLMAALANGVAVVTNRGQATEEVWAQSGGVLIAPRSTPSAMGDAVAALLDDNARRSEVARRGRSLYDRCFAIEHTVRTLLDRRGGVR